VKIQFENRFQQWSYLISRVLLGAIFIYAAIVKMDSPQDFADSIAAYHILPFSVINLLALGIPFFELVCGLLVFTGFFLRVGVLGILLILAVFTGAIGIALLRGLSIDCGCFGARSWLDSSAWVGFLRDAILLGLAAYVYGRSLSEQQP
jgi:putative oxidoreductase